METLTPIVEALCEDTPAAARVFPSRRAVVTESTTVRLVTLGTLARRRLPAPAQVGYGC